MNQKGASLECHRRLSITKKESFDVKFALVSLRKYQMGEFAVTLSKRVASGASFVFQYLEYFTMDLMSLLHRFRIVYAYSKMAAAAGTNSALLACPILTAC